MTRRSLVLKCNNGVWVVLLDGQEVYTSTHWIAARDKFERIKSQPLTTN
jgi:hypothetical protein